MVQIDSVVGTVAGLKFYEWYKEIFGEIKSAQMDHVPNKGYTLTLKNKNDEEIKFDSSFSAGYYGEGCRGTVSILKMAGFDNIDLEFVAKNKTFSINR